MRRANNDKRETTHYEGNELPNQEKLACSEEKKHKKNLRIWEADTPK